MRCSLLFMIILLLAAPAVADDACPPGFLGWIRAKLRRAEEPPRPPAEWEELEGRLGAPLGHYEEYAKGARQDANRIATRQEVDLRTRMLAGDDSALGLEKLGWERQERSGRTNLVPPASVRPIFEKANREIAELISRGVITEEQAIRPAIVFYKETLGNTLTRKREFLLVRPGIDPVPGPEWTADFWYGDLPLKDYAQALSEGKMPVLIAADMYHDVGHVTEYLARPAFMAEMRAFWTRMATGQLRYSGARGRLFERRVFYFSENGTLPDWNKLPEMKARWSHLFDRREPANLAEHLAEVEKLSDAELNSRGAMMTEKTNSYFVRIGGGERDLHNRESAYGYMDRKIVRELRGKSGVVSENHRQVTLESLAGLAEEIRRLSRLYKHPGYRQEVFAKSPLARFSREEQLKRIRRLYVDRVARLETAIRTAHELKITPEQLVRDAGQEFVDPNSPTARFFRSFLPEDGVLYESFLGKGAVKKPDR